MSLILYLADLPFTGNVICSCQPIESIRDIGTILNPVWTMKAGYAAGKSWSLDEVENYLRNPTPFE